MNRPGVRRALFAAVLFAAVGVASQSASAQTSGGGELGVGYVRATSADLGSGTFAGGGLATRAPSSVSPFRWTRVDLGRVCVVFPGGPPAGSNAIPMPGVSVGSPLAPSPAVGVPPGMLIVSRELELPPDATVVGTFVEEVGDDPTRTNDLVIFPRCIAPNEPLLAAPPSAADIWQQTPLPRAVVHASPPGTREWPGIVRLGTDFWGDGLPVTSATVTIGAFTVDVVATPIAYAWSFGDGSEVVTPDPVTRTRVAYLRRGDFDVTSFVVWEGRARLTIRGVDVGELDLGTVTIPERVPYRVSEIRAVLRTTPGRR